MKLRPATTDDLDALSALGRESFIATFGHLYSPENLGTFLEANRTPAKFGEKLAEPGTRIHLAEEDGKLLGYSLIELGIGMEERPEPKPARPVFLSQLYCAPDALGRGVGVALMDWVMDQARAYRADEIQLSVFSENFRAQSFYHRYGFSKLADIDYWVGDHRDDEFLYSLALTPAD